MLRAELPQRNGSPPAIIFHGIKGENHRDSESPSWYNPEEATQVYLYLLKLYKYGLEPDDIGVITPYQKQVCARPSACFVIYQVNVDDVNAS
jgi:RNA helicase armi